MFTPIEAIFSTYYTYTSEFIESVEFMQDKKFAVNIQVK